MPGLEPGIHAAGPRPASFAHKETTKTPRHQGTKKVGNDLVLTLQTGQRKIPCLWRDGMESIVGFVCVDYLRIDGLMKAPDKIGYIK
jgi:hypothetical protein